MGKNMNIAVGIVRGCQAVLIVIGAIILAEMFKVVASIGWIPVGRPEITTILVDLFGIGVGCFFCAGLLSAIELLALARMQK